MTMMEVENQVLISLIDSWKLRDELFEQVCQESNRRGMLMLKQEKKIKVCQFCFAKYHAEDCEWNNEVKEIKNG